MIMGTSTCHILVGTQEKLVPGMCGVVQDGVLPGFLGYEAGQSCVGDHFDWFVSNCVPESYELQAREKGVNIHQLLTEKAAQLKAAKAGCLRWIGGTATAAFWWTWI